ncbi:unnamed protein product [Hermetia illucens]|uniref:Enoyl-CoA hydratase domain-containing protein 3, mitochondrial n=2 Tax=Hermetia illucens TaxID=343691 RepID=A0A7R8YXF5_HERIL|nr:enoyl-CoA hydratase domain-containing protein 3, mitochondrial isoform X1 [Hermetia illucens]CAD7087842.1 unnamed protein product [Hermetia illucens]
MLRILPKSLRYANIKKFHTSGVSHRSLVTCTDKDGIREFALNDPKRRNALSMEMMDELLAGLTTGLDDRNIGCAVISSTGSVFSSGHNFKELAPEEGYDNHKKVFTKCADLMRAIHNAPVPIIAKVDGLAAAGGCQLVASCDIVVCTDRSSFSTPGANFGLFCSTPGIAISRTIPRNKALYMLFTGLPISAQEAYIAGLVSQVVPQNELDKKVNEICRSIISKSRNVLELGKQFYHKQILMDIETAYECGATVMADNLNLPDGQEGVRSFFDKRRPKWKK